MTSLSSAFANLEQVGVNGDVTSINGSDYSVVVEGLRFVSHACTHFTPDNTVLTDIGNLLTFQVISGLNTYVVGNPVLCFTSSIVWGRLPHSLIHFHISAVCREPVALIICVNMHFRSLLKASA